MGLTDFLLRISNFLILLHGNVQLFVIYILCVENPFLHIGGNMVYYKQCSGTLLLQKAAELQNWAQWTHHAEGKTHCEECLKLDGCWFQKKSAPPCPHHPYCHCTLEPIDYANGLLQMTTPYGDD